MFKGFHSGMLSKMILRIARNGVNKIIPERPHKSVPAIMATRVDQVLRFNWAPTTRGNMTLDSRYWIKAKTATTAVGYQAESLVIRAIETGMEALIKMPV